MFKSYEWRNFIRATNKRPHLWISYFLDFSRLVFRRVFIQISLRLKASEHRGLKEWPRWLGTQVLIVKANKKDQLRFPVYKKPIKLDMPAIMPELVFAKDDPEGYFFANRWGYCVQGSLCDESIAKTAMEKVLSWIKNQPVQKDAAWEPYSACERAVNLAVMLSVHQGIWERLTHEDKCSVVDFFVKSAQWIHNKLEYYGVKRTNNHILNNARALIVIGCIIDNIFLLERGLKLCANMSEVMILPEGSLRERSSHYQCVVTNWLLDVVHFSSTCSLFSDKAKSNFEYLEKLSLIMAKTTGQILTTLNGSDSHIGDISPDNHPVISEYRFRHLYSDKLSLVNDSNFMADDWLSVQCGESTIISCAMPHRYPLIYNTHGHRDIGSFVWKLRGKPILVDRGRGSYNLNTVDIQQCSSAGHNTIKVNDLSPLADSVIPFGEWFPTPYAQASINSTLDEEHNISISHNGFSRIPNVGSHSRVITITNEYLMVKDQIDGNGTVDIEFFWHFSPDLKPISESELIVVGNDLKIHIDTNFPLETTKWCLGQHSTAYGDFKEGQTLHLVSRVQLPLNGITIMRFNKCAV